MKTALGMITKRLGEEPLRFIKNAEKYGHTIDGVVATHSHGVDEAAAREIGGRAPLYPVNIGNPEYAARELKRRGVSEKSRELLLCCPRLGESGLMPYGFNRNLVLIEAILRGFEAIVFVDTDIFPTVLCAKGNGVAEVEVDFIGGHTDALLNGSQITTSEYSGYNILPPCEFDGMEELLLGVQKDDMLDYWRASPTHRSLALQTSDRKPVPTTKILGGNTAFKLDVFSSLPPFFSTYFTCGGEYYLARGEDTLLGPAIRRTNTVCTDIRLNPLHDTYKNYPTEPSLKNDPDAQNRFYYAMTGWVGRNPLLNHLQGRGDSGRREAERRYLAAGVRALSEYTKNPRYLALPEIFDAANAALPRYIEELNRNNDAWFEFIKRSELP